MGLLTLSTTSFAAYTATGQFCTLSPDKNNAKVLASCDVDTGKIVLIGAPPNKVSEVRFLHPANKQPRQILELKATPLIDPETVSIMFVDFNFDGHKDFAIMPKLQASENVKYLYFLYQPKTGRYQASSEMAPIVNPEVNRSEKHIRSYWRETPTLSGWHLWKWKNGHPYIATRIEQKSE